jgi:hypothetical protein
MQKILQYEDAITELNAHIDTHVKARYQGLRQLLKELGQAEMSTENHGDPDSDIEDVRVKPEQLESIKRNVSVLYNYFSSHQLNIKNHSKRYTQSTMWRGATHEIKDPYHFNLYASKSLEEIYDGFQKITNYDDVLKYSKSFLRSYKDLCVSTQTNPKGESFPVIDEESFRLFQLIKELGLPRAEIAQQLSKVASYDNTEALNTALKQITQSHQLNRDMILKQIESENHKVRILHDDDKIFAIALTEGDFEASQSLGSSQWCISTSEDYFNEYLNTIDDDFKSYDNAAEESDVAGTHVFVWNFEHNAEHPSAQIAFTVAASGSITAAHDKNDDDILNKLEDILDLDTLMALRSKACLSQPAIFYGAINHSSPENILEESNILVSHCKYPLKDMYEFCQHYDFAEMLSDAQQVYLLQNILSETFSRYETLHNDDYSAADLVKHGLWLEKLVQTHFAPQEDYDYDDDDNDGDHYHTMKEEDDKEVTCEIDPNDVVNNKVFQSAFLALSAIQRTVTFKQHEETLVNVCKQEAISFDNRGIFDRLNDGHYPELKIIHSPMLLALADQLINHDNVSESMQNMLIISKNFHPDSSASLSDIDKLFTLIDDDKLSLNKVLISSYDQSTSFNQRLGNYLNENLDKLGSFCPNSVYQMSNNKPLMDTLNGNASHHIRTCLKRFKEFHIERSDGGKLTELSPPFESHGFNLGDSMRALFNKEMIDADIVGRLNTSRVSFGDKGKCLDENKKQVDIQLYIMQDKNALRKQTVKSL